MSSFSLSFAVADDGETELRASIDAEAMKGECRYWCHPREFADLAKALTTYPIPQGSRVDGKWCGGCISLTIEPLDLIGNLLVKAGIDDELSAWTKCQAEFRSSYADVARFREGLIRALTSGVGTAEL